MTASTESSLTRDLDPRAFLRTVTCYQPFHDREGCEWVGGVHRTEDDAREERDRHLVEHANREAWPEGTKVKWVKRTGRNLDNIEWWRGIVIEHIGHYIKVDASETGYRDRQLVKAEDLRHRDG